MAQEDVLRPAHELYTSHVEKGARGGLAEELWGRIPTTMGEAYGLLKGVKAGYGEASDSLEELKGAMKSNLRRLGILTSSVSENIDRLENGVVETGQQPNAIGGPSLVLNKIAYAKSLSGMGEEGYVPLFYMADYDGVQPELTNTRVPSPSSRGVLISYPTSPEQEGVPIHEIPNPSEAWLNQTLDKLTSNYRGLLNGADSRLRERALMNLDHAITVLKSAFHSTENVSDWSTKVIGSIVNLEADLGVPILSHSMPGTRHIFQQGYEVLLTDSNRETFIEVSNRAAEKVEASGHRPGIGLRDPDYVPFFYECQTPGCQRRRVELGYRRDTGSTTASVGGKCPKCGAVYEFSFNASTPDLSDIVGSISPRVDSRQIIMDSVLPILAHVGGPGETNYYSEVIPAAKAVGLPFPVFLRYTRLFYNTPWNEGYAKELKWLGYRSLADERLFSALSGWVQARNQGDTEGLKKAHVAIRSCVESTDRELREILEGLNAEIEGIKRKLSSSEDRGALIAEMRGKQAMVQKVEVYLSSALGRFSPERFGQEVSWAWLDVAVVSGMGDLMGVFMRQYSENTPNSSMFYANLG
ncbi:bacillithiol biosynthesis BshC [Candidatus Bathyarchaeota archaeon]|nr:bacillithiol biosynthesis BshC [Candidatus Bathyarchaeota archaeon]